MSECPKSPDGYHDICACGYCGSPYLNKEIERLEKELSHWKYVAADYEISCTQQNVERLEGVRDAAIPIADNGYAEESDITRLREALDKEGT